MAADDPSGMYYATGFSFTRRHDVPHYYGDVVRSLFVIAAVLSAIAIPLFGNLLPFGMSVEVICTLLLVLLAGLTNPHGKLVMGLDTLFAALGVYFLESAAISQYSADHFLLFLAREAAGLCLLVAFYYSVKTWRAMLDGRIGKEEPANEFTPASAEHSASGDSEAQILHDGAND